MGMDLVKLGHTDLHVTRIGFGGAAIGGMHGRAISEEQAIATVHRALSLGMNLLDTAPAYGTGQSERYIGKALAAWDGPMPIISTKVGRVPEGFDYSYDITMASVEASMERLGVDHLPLVHLHAVQMAPSVAHVLSPQGSLGALRALQEQGVIDWIGVGTPRPIIAEYIASGEVDVALVANQYDLIDRSAAEHILPLAIEQKVGVMLAGAYGTGILATGPIPGAKYFYRDATPEVLATVQRFEDLCRQFDVPLKAVALHFCLRHAAVDTVILGTSRADHVDDMIADLNTTIPDGLWEVIDSGSATS
jgi:D-threo-aldose 1-dehydrogenase